MNCLRKTILKFIPKCKGSRIIKIFLEKTSSDNGLAQWSKTYSLQGEGGSVVLALGQPN